MDWVVFLNLQNYGVRVGKERVEVEEEIIKVIVSESSRFVLFFG